MTWVQWTAAASPAVGGDWVWDDYDDRTRRGLVVRASDEAATLLVSFRTTLPTEATTVSVTATLDGKTIKGEAWAEGLEAWGSVAVTATFPVVAAHLLSVVVRLAIPDADTGKTRVRRIRERFDVFVSFGEPVAPWRPDGHLNRPWLRAAAVAVRAASGAADEDDALARLQRSMWTGLPRTGRQRTSRLVTDTPLRLPWVDLTPNYMNLLYLLQHYDGDLEELAAGCQDQTSVVALLATLLGIDVTVGLLCQKGTTFSTEPVYVADGKPASPREVVKHYVLLRKGQVLDCSYRFKPAEPIIMNRFEYGSRFPDGVKLVDIDGPAWRLSEVEPAPKLLRKEQPVNALSIQLATTNALSPRWKLRRRGTNRFEVFTEDDRESVSVELLAPDETALEAVPDPAAFVGLGSVPVRIARGARGGMAVAWGRSKELDLDAIARAALLGAGEPLAPPPD